MLEDGEEGFLADGALHEELEVGGDLVAVEEAVFVVAGDGDGGGFDADVLGGDGEHFGDGAFQVAGDDGHDGVAVDAIHALGFGGGVGDVLGGEGVDAEAGYLVFEGGEALELCVEGVACWLYVFRSTVRGEEDCGIYRQAEVGVGVGVEAAEDEDGGRANVDGVVVVAEALGVGDVELGDFEEGWGAEEVAFAVGVDGDEGDGGDAGGAGFVDVPGGGAGELDGNGEVGGGGVGAPEFVPAGFQDTDLVGDFFAVAAGGRDDGFADADLLQGRRPAVVRRAPAEDLVGGDGDEVGLAYQGSFFGEVAGLCFGREVDDCGAVAVEDGGDELAAGVFVEGGAVAGDVGAPGGPVGVAGEFDAFAEDDAGSLRGQPRQERRQGGVEDAAVVGGGVFAGLLGDDVAGAGAEFKGAAEADVDGVPGGLH